MRAAVVALALALSWPLAAFPGSEQVQAYQNASAKFQGLLKEYAEAGAEPSAERLSPLLAQLTDENVFVAARSSDDPLRSFLDICGAANAANVSLALFGLANSGVKSKGPAEVAIIVRGLAERNTLKFQEVTLPLTSFLTSCFAFQMPYMSRFVQNLPADQLTPTRLAGLSQARNGMEEFLSGALLSVAEPRFNEKLRFVLVNALASRSPAYAESLPRERRDGIRRVADLVLPRVPVHFRLSVRRVIEAMNVEQCNSLCAL